MKALLDHENALEAWWEGYEKAWAVPPPTKTSSSGVGFIADYEGGYHATPYDDGYGNLTIGYGHLIRAGENFTSLTKEQAQQLLSSDLASFESMVTSHAATIGVVWDQCQYDAFVSLAYNSGIYFKSVMDKIANGMNPYDAFSTIIYAGGEKSLGLYRRRMDEADIFVYGTYNRTYRNWS